MNVNDVKTELEQKFGSQIQVSVDRDWVWIDGETYSIRGDLKSLGARWASHKGQWYIICADKSDMIPNTSNRKPKKKAKKPKPKVDLIRFRLSWGAPVAGYTKVLAYGSTEIEAVSEHRAKVIATQSVKAWAQQRCDDQKINSYRQQILSSMKMGNGKWKRSISKETNKPLYFKRLGGMWSRGEYIALKQL